MENGTGDIQVYGATKQSALQELIGQLPRGHRLSDITFTESAAGGYWAQTIPIPDEDLMKKESALFIINYAGFRSGIACSNLGSFVDL